MGVGEQGGMCSSSAVWLYSNQAANDKVLTKLEIVLTNLNIVPTN